MFCVIGAVVGQQQPEAHVQDLSSKDESVTQSKLHFPHHLQQEKRGDHGWNISSQEKLFVGNCAVSFLNPLIKFIVTGFWQMNSGVQRGSHCSLCQQWFFSSIAIKRSFWNVPGVNYFFSMQLYPENKLYYILLDFVDLKFPVSYKCITAPSLCRVSSSCIARLRLMLDSV